MFQVTIKDTDPIVFYCSQNASDHNHCKSGMMGFVNQADESVMTTYMMAAADSSVNVSPDVGPFGGSLVDNPNNSSSGNSTGTTKANSTSTSTATSSTTETGKSTETDSSASSTNTGSPRNNNGGAALAGSGFLAVMAAVMAF